MNKEPEQGWLIWTIVILSLILIITILGIGLISEVSYQIAKFLGIIFIILFMILTMYHIKKIK
jgi:uncharacterized membrane protein YtjA (UPF0391 family)